MLSSHRLRCSTCIKKLSYISKLTLNTNSKTVLHPEKCNISLARHFSFNPVNRNTGSTANHTSRKIRLASFLTGSMAIYSFLPINNSHAFWPSSPFSQNSAVEESSLGLQEDSLATEEKTPTEKVEMPSVNSVWKDAKITLYQYQNCPFCSKVRSFLLAYDIPFTIVEVHPFNKKEISFSEYKKLPLITIEQDDVLQINDSSVIISAMSSYMIDPNSKSLEELVNNFPITTELQNGKEVKLIRNKNFLFINEHLLTSSREKALIREAKWRDWVDDYFIHLISPNLYRTISESVKAFDYHISLGPYKGTWEGFAAKYFGSVGMWAIGKMIKKKYGISKDVRADLYAACNKVSNKLKSQKYLGGDLPNLADISLYGMLTVMENQQVMKDIEKNNKSFMKWFRRMEKSVKKHRVEDLRKNLKYEKLNVKEA